MEKFAVLTTAAWRPGSRRGGLVTRLFCDSTSTLCKEITYVDGLAVEPPEAPRQLHIDGQLHPAGANMTFEVAGQRFRKESRHIVIQISFNTAYPSCVFPTAGTPPA